MRHLAALAIPVSMLLAQSERAVLQVTAVRSWSLSEVTRVAVEVTGGFEFNTDRLHNPERVYFDIRNARPRLDNKRIYSKEINDKLVQRVRVAETAPSVTRVVLDLAAPVEISTSQLSNPTRLMIELRPGKPPAVPSGITPAAPDALNPSPAVKADPPAPGPAMETPSRPDLPAVKPDPLAIGKVPVTVPLERTVEPAKTAEPIKAAMRTTVADKPAAEKPAPALPIEISKAARHTSTGGSSLTRALGLKVGRIVIDPGHGGHDTGTQGVKGLAEKELVLDVAQRVGKLIEERMNAEVIYTRTDDTFIPLEGRTALANEKKADLFLSIHANSSSFPRIAGVETFYLNFTDSKDALDVASRENASSQKSIFELQDIIQKISMHEKLDESKEFASRVQSALFAFTSHNVPGERNRGIKKAPFVVLIGANMPSVLAEIGFLTNPREEAQLKKSDYRQKLAEALYRGISRYAESLSHFQVAQNQSRPE